MPKHLGDGQDRSESAKGAERMRRHVGGKDARTLRRIYQSGFVCGIVQYGLGIPTTTTKYLLHLYSRYYFCRPTQYVSHMLSIWGRCNSRGARILASTCLGLVLKRHRRTRTTICRRSGLSGMMIWGMPSCWISYLGRICTLCSSSPSNTTAETPD